MTSSATASSTAVSNATQAESSIWNKVLSTASKQLKTPLRTILLLGDGDSGKSSLLARFQNVDITSQASGGIALDYSFIDLPDPENEEVSVARINVFHMEASTHLKSLMDFAINPTTLEEGILAMIVLDFTQPWFLVSSLTKALELLTQKLESLPKDESASLKKALERGFQNYKEAPATTNNTANNALDQKVNPNLNNDKIGKPIFAPSNSDDDRVDIPLGEGVLTNNLGIPILVVCAKSDGVEHLAAEYLYKDAHFDFIQTYLRRLCLSYGAGLVYTSAKKDKNCDVLYTYIKHILFSTPFYHSAQLLEKDTIFVPIGWDSLGKIKIDFDNQKLSTDADAPFDEVIKPPKNLKSKLENTAEVLVVAEDDQDFLLRQQAIIGQVKEVKDDNKTLRRDDILTKDDTISSASVQAPSPATQTSAAKTPASSAASASTLSATALDKGPIKTTKSSFDLKTPVSPSGEAEHQVLANFFNSLINKGGQAPITRGKAPSLSSTPQEKRKEGEQ